MKRLLLYFTLFSLLFFLALFVYVGITIRTTRDNNIALLYEQFTGMRTDAVSSYLASGSFQSERFKAHMNETFMNNVRLLLLGIYSDDGIQYLLAKNRSYLKTDVQQEDPWTGKPEYRLLPISEKVFSLPFSPADRTDLHIDGMYVILGRQDLYPILKNAFFILLVFLLISAIFVLVVTTIDPSRLEARPQRVEKTFFSTSTGLVLEHYLEPRLRFELEKAADSGNDLVLAIARIDGFSAAPQTEALYNAVARHVDEVFSAHNLVFSWKEGGYAVIMPGADLEEGMRRAEILRQNIASAKLEGQDVTLSVGLTARNSRAIDERTILIEASASAEKASSEGQNQVIAFRVDPAKYQQQAAR